MRRTVVVVGSGIAGLTTALHAASHHDVVLVTAGALEESNTAWAQGGIAGVLDTPDTSTGSTESTQAIQTTQGDSVFAHIGDTLRAGAGLCAEDAVRILCSEAPERLRELISLGVPFDRSGGEFARALEAAHSAPRVLHAGGDATGAAIECVLAAHARTRLDVILEHTRLVDLVLRDGAVAGVSLRGASGPIDIAADAVVIATGGFAGLYSLTSNPRGATGSGIAVAARAGAVLADLEFVQFHPSVLAAPGSFLVSEAVRGEGAVLRNERGERFMVGEHPDAELAPRDVVARAIAREMRRQGGRPVVLDATGIDGAHLDARFPGIARRVRAAGLDWTTSPVPVTPAAHYTMGGIATDLDGRSSVPGLFAVGEAARTGVHGANRLASNSLMEGAVFGARVAAALSHGERPPLAVEARETADTPIPRSHTGSLGSSSALGDLLWDEVGLVRSEEGLERAIAGIDALAEPSAPAEGNPVGPADGTRDALTVGTLLAHAALLRRESRGAHARADHPETDPSLARPLFVRGVLSEGDAAPTQHHSQNRNHEETIVC